MAILDIDPEHSALLLVDIQPDFFPGGPLAVAQADEIIAPVSQLMRHGPFAVQVATQDWHPAGHASFASSHEDAAPFDTIEMHGHVQTLWPDHCVQGTRGAGLTRGLPWEFTDLVLRKGIDPDVDSYSGFRENWNADGKRAPTGLAGYLRERGVQQLFCCGLARDYCVLWTAEDAADEGFEAYFLWDLTRPVDPAADEQVRSRLAKAGVQLVDAADLNLP